MVDGIRPIEDIFGGQRLSQALAGRRQEREAAPLRALQLRSAELGVEKQEQGLAQQAQAQAFQNRFKQGFAQKPADMSNTAFSVDFFRREGRPELAQKAIESASSQIKSVAELDGAKAAELYNRELANVFGTGPIEFAGESDAPDFGKQFRANRDGKPIMMALNKGTGAFEEIPLPEGVALAAPTGLTPEQRQQELDIKARAQGARESELAERQAETKRKAGELKPTMQKILDNTQTIAFDSEKTANEFDLLVGDFQRTGFGGGVGATISDFLKDVLGEQDEVSALKRKFRGIRASQATKNLPPGPASDKDIALALSGFPPENAPAETVASFLKGASKLARIDQAFQTFKAEFISDNKNTVGMLRAWRENRARLIDDAVAEFEEGAVPGETIVTRHATLGDVTEDDIKETMSQNNLTRDEVLRRLGVQ